MKCPKCHRNTYSEKWETCTACQVGEPEPDVLVSEREAANARGESWENRPATPEVPNRYQVHLRICLSCGKDFQGTARGWYCSSNCRQDAHRRGVKAPANAMQTANLLAEARVPGAPSPPKGLALRFKIFMRDAFRCRYCGRSPQDGVKLHLEHMKARHNGGTNDEANLLTACADCNLGKGVKELTVAVP